jgi:hypothetical protein
MYKVIVNGTEHFECSSFEEQYDGLSQAQMLQLLNDEVPENFIKTWADIARAQPIQSVEIQYQGQTLVSYDYYNIVQYAKIRPFPESLKMEGVVNLVHREV